MNKFEICFICRFPTTDSLPNESGEPTCGLCQHEAAQEEARIQDEYDAVYYAMGEHWEEDMREMLADYDEQVSA